MDDVGKLKIHISSGKRKTEDDELEGPKRTSRHDAMHTTSFNNAPAIDLYDDLDTFGTTSVYHSDFTTLLNSSQSCTRPEEAYDDEFTRFMSPDVTTTAIAEPLNNLDAEIDKFTSLFLVSDLIEPPNGVEVVLPQSFSSTSSSASLAFNFPENEPTFTDEGVSLVAGQVYHDTMYSSEDENSEEEIECQDPSEENSKQDDEEEEESEADFVDFDNDDIDALLEGNDGYGLKTEQEKADKVPLILSLEKHILVEKSNHHFEFLPNGWLKVIHQSGMPVYFHRETRICTLSRPYGLGKASLRAHKIPVSAIPCLEYQRAKEEETKIRTEPVEGSAFCPLGQDISKEIGGADARTAIFTADDHVQNSLLSAVALREYCSRLFEFKSKTVRRYSSWKVGRGQLRIAKKVRAGEKAQATSTNTAGEMIPGEADTPITMIKSAKIITIARPSPDGKSQITFNLNPANKTPVSILSEYVQHARKLQPTYQFLELPDSNTPYQAVILVAGKEEGRGMGASKKAAKSEAAKNAILKLAPELKSIFEARSTINKDDDIFDDILIDDHRISEIAHKSSHLAPYQLLVNALQRLDTHTTLQRPEFESKKKGHLKNVYTMKAGKHTVSYTHQLHNFAKQMCSQLILKEMHPELKYYGDLLKLYGRHVDREKVKKRENQRAITDLQTKGKWGEPNWELLDKLKEVMKSVTPVPLRSGETSRIRY